ncbi:MAG: 2-oxoacid:ferredoxin oxidoreductase subunit beta [Bacteroidetes bacterium]|nr:MAG: 2-oxoacid:ferredoxin oxidoreductase subunit beta [Bacteroidota bacterium]
MTEVIKVDQLQNTKADFKSDQVIKWCAGCGDFAILSAIQSTLVESNVRKEDVVFVSGIGCSSRFPYYMNTYGFHGLHGRGAAIASGIKVANPKLDVWHITGDGDSMAIGGNHFIHLIRRNIDMNVILFNNKIYGLTKGQYSPTTPRGSITKSSPDGTIENPFKPGELTMGAQGSFFARVVDTEPKRMKEVFLEATKHRGTSVVEVLQNCVIFNNRIHSEITGKDVRDDHQIHLEHGKPMVFGKEKNKGLVLKGSRLEVVTIGKNGITEKDILVHDVHSPDDTTHYMLVRMTLPEYPVATGVIRACECSNTYEAELEFQVERAKKKVGMNSLQELLEEKSFIVD